MARDDTDYLKPDVRHLKQAIQKMESTKEKAWRIIGDGRLDMECGKKLGLVCIGVLTGSASKELRLAGADLIIDSCLK